MVVHIVTTGHEKVKISIGTSVLVTSHLINQVKYVKISQPFQISERSLMLQKIVKIILNLIIIKLSLLLILSSSVCTCVCVCGRGLMDYMAVI
jgi:hypothetical protein